MPLSCGGAEPCRGAAGGGPFSGKAPACRRNSPQQLQQHREGSLRQNLLNFYPQRGTKEKERQPLPCKPLENRDKLQLRWKRRVVLTTSEAVVLSTTRLVYVSFTRLVDEVAPGVHLFNVPVVRWSRAKWQSLMRTFL